MVSHLRMNECRFRIIPIRLWFRTALEERGSAEIGSVGEGAPAVVKPLRAAPAGWIGSL